MVRGGRLLSALAVVTHALGCADGVSPPAGGLVVDPPVLELGIVTLGGAVRGRLGLRNEGVDRRSLAAVALEGGDPTQLYVDAWPAAVVAGGTGRIELVFAPEAAGTWQATLSLTATDGEVWTVPVTGTAVARGIAVRPEALDFGPVRVGEVATATVTLENATERPRRIVAVTRSLETSPEFAASLSGQVAVPAFGRSTLTVEYRPADIGGDRGRLVFVDDDPAPDAPSLRVEGSGRLQPVQVEPAQVTLRSVVVGQRRTRRLLVRNVASVAARLETPQVQVLEGPAAFSVSSTQSWPHTLGPGGTVALDVEFAPTAAVAHRAALALAVEGSSAPTQVSLFGEARTALEPRLTLWPPSGGAMAVPAGRASSAPLVLFNRGTGPLVLAGPPVLRGDGVAVRRAFPASLRLAPGDSHALDLTLSPAEPGTREVALEIPFADGSTLTWTSSLHARAEPTPVGVVWRPVDLGAVARGVVATGQVLLQNVGSATAAVTVGGLEGGDGLFRLGATPTALGPGDTGAVPVVFEDPQGLAGTRTATLRLTLDDDLVAVPLRAATVAPALETDRLVVRLEAPGPSEGLALQLLRPGGAIFDAPGAAQACAPGPDWGAFGEPQDDPRHLRGDDGTETVRLRVRSSDTYDVWVHHGGRRAATARVVIEDALGGFDEVQARLAPGEAWGFGFDRNTLTWVGVPAPATENRCY